MSASRYPERCSGLSHTLLASLFLLSNTFPFVESSQGTFDITNNILHPLPDLFPRASYEKRADDVPLVVTNNCPETIWPAIGTQAGTGPKSQGFELAPGDSMSQTVSGDWQGRLWGRTNCSFNADGTGASNLNGNNGAGAACSTGDCGGVLNCVVTGATPVTLAELDLAGGSANKQTFYDISLVDGYNIPLGMKYIPGNNSALEAIPPNLTNPACIGTMGFLSDPAASGTEGGSTNSSFPIPYEQTQTNEKLMSWCPWDLQVNQPTKPGDGVYPYPDDNIQRPAFDPCLSACSKTNAPSDCCTGSFDTPQACKPNLYATSAKAVCPDAYSYAFDDQTSTFIIPSGGGWEITFCPAGRSTNILQTFKAQLEALSSANTVSAEVLADAQNITIIQKGEGGIGIRGERYGPGSWAALVVVVAWLCLF